MTKTKTTTTTTTDELPRTLPLSALAFAGHPDNIRRDLGDLTALADSIAEQGVLEPLVIAPHPEPDGEHEWILIAGHRRLAAAQIAMVDEVPVWVRTDLTTRAAQVAAMVAENGHRADLTPIEEANGYQLLLDLDEAPSTRVIGSVAKATGMPRRRVVDRLRLLDLSEQGQSAVHAGQITLGQAAEVLDLPDDVQDEVLEQVGTQDFTQTLHAAQIRAEEAAKVAVIIARAEASGSKIVAAYEPNLSNIRGGEYGVDSAIGWSGIEETGTPEAFEAVLAAHASCPGHVVKIPEAATNTWQISIMCSEWSSQHVRPTAGQAAGRSEVEDDQLGDVPTDPEWEAQRAAVEEDRIARAAASRSRAEWLHALLQRRDLEQPAATVLRKIWQAAMDHDEVMITEPWWGPGWSWTFFATVLGLDLSIEDNAVRTQSQRDAVARLDGHQLALWLWIVDGALQAETPLSMNEFHVSDNPLIVQWLTDLTELGYRLSSLEEVHLGLANGDLDPADEDNDDEADE